MNSRLVYLGHPVRLRYRKNAGIVALRQDNRHRYTIFLPDGTQEADAARYLEAFSGDWSPEVDRPTEDRLKVLCAEWASELQVSEPVLVFFDNTRLWGQADWQRNEVRLSRQLLLFPSVCGEAVLMHELCHFLHHDHDRQFWRLLSEKMPDWAAREGLLRSGTNGEETDDL